MEFLDNSGHIFSLPSFIEEPLGHEFEENDYIFWVDSIKSNKLSINNYYSRTINLVIPYDQEVEDVPFNDLVDIEISINSNKFWLLRPIDIQEIINDNKSVKDYIDLQKFLVEQDQEEPGYIYNNKKLTNDDLFVFTISESDEEIFNQTGKNINWPTDHLAIIPLYIITTSDEEGTWISNILIHVKNKSDKKYDIEYSALISEDWCSISVGAEYINENEILTINGQNMGINLPKDLFRAVYQVSFQNNEFNESIYNEKIKEYLLNYMDIRGEIGNYKSAISSLNWFGYGDKIQLTKLIKTDNHLRDQYINDSFNISTDILKSFRYFRNSTLLSLKLKENEDTSQYNDINIKNDFWGEGKPILEDLFNKQVEELVGYEEDKWSYWKPYYDFSLYEMGLKISCLKYYYETYFLPIHLKVHSASIVHKVYANDIKYNNYVYNTNRTEENILLGKDHQVYFDTNNVRYFTHQLHFVDQFFNEFYGYDQEDDIYKIDETCLNIPIRFINDKDNDGKEIPTYFNCVLLLEKEKRDNEYFLPYRLNIFKPFNIFYYNLIINEKNFNNVVNLDKYNFAYSYLYQDNYSNWYTGYNNFKNELKEIFKIQLNTNYKDSIEENIYNLVYLYKNDDIILNIIWNRETIVNIFGNNNIGSVQLLNGENILELQTIEETLTQKFGNIVDKKGNKVYDINGLINILKDIQPSSIPYELNTQDWYVYIPSIEEFEFNPMHVEDIIGNIVIIPKMNFKLKFDDTEINDIILQNKVNNTKISIKDNIKINYVPENSLVYESHFSFIQSPDNFNTYYNCFVLYPKILNKININYFVNQKFKIKLLVNDKWYYYEFISKMPDLNLQFGNLKYKYWETSDNYYSKFSQLSDIEPNIYNEDNELVHKGYIKFNSFMHEPEMVTVDHINYYEDILKYIKINNIKYLDGSNEDIRLENFNRFISIESEIMENEDFVKREFRIYFHKNLVFNSNQQNNFFIDQEYLNGKSLRIISSDLIFTETEDNTFKLINQNRDINNIIELYFKLKDNYNDNTIYKELENIKEKLDIDVNINNTEHISEELYFSLTNIINIYNRYFEKNISIDDIIETINNIRYLSQINYSNNTIKYQLSKFIYEQDILMLYPLSTYKIYENMISDIKNIYQNFDFNLNINKNNYLNNIHIFDIYEPYISEKTINIFDTLRNIRINCNGINFYHLIGDSKIWLNGKTIYDEDVDSRFVDLYGFYYNTWANTSPIKEENKKISNTDHFNRIQIDFHKLEQFINKGFKVKYYYYVDYYGNPTNNEYTIITKDNPIGKIILDTFDDIKNIENHDLEEYFDIQNEYIKDFNGFKYISLNAQDSEIQYIYKTSYLINNVNKKIFIKVSYVTGDSDKYNYNYVQNITNDDALHISLGQPLDHIKVLVEFYEYIYKKHNNKLVYYSGDILQENPKDPNSPKYFIDPDEKKIYLTPYYYNQYIDERNNCEIPVDEVMGNSIFLGNPAFRFLKIKINFKINDNKPLAVINEEDKVVISTLNTMTTYRNKFDSLREYLDYINKNPKIIKEDENDIYQKINDIYTYWNENITEKDLSNEDIYNQKILNIKKALKENNTYNVNPYINLRDYIVQKEFTLKELLYSLNANSQEEEMEFEFSCLIKKYNENEEDLSKWDNETRVNLILEITHKNNVVDIIYCDYNNDKDNPQRIKISNTDICKLYIKINKDQNSNSIELENEVYVWPIFKLLEKGYQKLKYKNYIGDNPINININGINYQYGLNNSKEIIDLYNEFFDVDYLPDTNPRIPKTITQELNGIVKEIETLYEIENKYLVWRQYNILNWYSFNNQVVDENSIIVEGSNEFNNYIYIYKDLNDQPIKFDDNNLILLRELGENENIGEDDYIDTSNLLNMIKFDFSILTKVDFYNIKVYKKLLNNNNLNNKIEIKIDENYLLRNYVKVIKSKINLKKYLDYDFYLMHDFDYWYGVFISKQVINKAITKKQLMISEENKEMNPSYISDSLNNIQKILYKKIKTNDGYKIVSIKENGLYGYNDYSNIYFTDFSVKRYNLSFTFNTNNPSDLSSYYIIIFNTIKIITSNLQLPLSAEDESLYCYIKYEWLDKGTHYSYNTEPIDGQTLNTILENRYNDDFKINNYIKLNENILKANMLSLVFTSYNFVDRLTENNIKNIKNIINRNPSLYNLIKEVKFEEDDYEYPEYEDVDFEYENNTKYMLKYVNSGNEFLINRMQFIPNNGINHFNRTDMIVGRVVNNPQLPINIFNSSKWNIHPISIGSNKDIKIESNSEMCLLSFPSNNNEYEKGYYDVDLRYSLDGNTQQQYFKKGKIRIG